MNNSITNLYNLQIVDQNNEIVDIQPETELIYKQGHKIGGHEITSITFLLDSVSADCFIVTVHVHIEETIQT